MRANRLKKFLLAAFAAAVIAAIVLTSLGFGGGKTVFASIGWGDGESGTATSTGLLPATVEVTKDSLQQTQQVGGILSRGEPVPLIAQGSSGVVTWIAEPGSVVELGDPVYKVDGKPVVLIHGTIPPYRTLQVGVVGPDVKQLESSLKEMGFTGFTVDEIFDSATANTVWAWQSKVGLEPTGYVTVDQIAVADGDIRIALQGLAVGSHLAGGANQTVVSYTGRKKYVTVPLDVSLQHLVAEGNAAIVTLPDGTKVSGKVSFVDAVAQTIEDKQIIEVHVDVKDQKALGALEAAPVTVELVTGTRKNVLTVPINALVALSGGGYGLEVVQNGQTSYVAVKTGMFAGGMVEVSGTGIAEGTTVGVAK
jgi:hypothetical protein